MFNDRVAEAVALGAELVADAGAEDEERRLRFEGWLAATAQFAPACAKPALERLERYRGTLRGETSGERLILACLAFGAAPPRPLGIGHGAARTAGSGKRPTVA